jgi:hypothetical protein
MFLVQLLLPLYDNAGQPQAPEQFARLREELTLRYGGITAYTRTPATGLWQQEGETRRDEVLVHEVMVDTLDAAWWADYRRELEQRFAQQELVVRAQPIQRL